MRPSRPDLLALGETELVALANRGLLKRAKKMLAAGGLSLSLEEDQTVVLKTADVETRLQPGRPLPQTLCSCGASGLCRHKVLAILAYQDSTAEVQEVEVWCPGQFGDEEIQKLVGPSAWRQANRLVGRGLHVRLERGQKPMAYLPTCSVAFLVPQDLSYARCDCSCKDPCEHIAIAILSFRQNGERVSLGLQEGRNEVCFDSAEKLLLGLLRCGVSSSEMKLVTRLRLESRKALNEKFVWLADILGELAESVEQYLERGAGYNSSLHCYLLMEWWTRTRAALHRSPDLLLGLGESPETMLEQTSLTCVGLRLHQQESESCADFYLAEPNTGVVTVLSRSWKGSLAGPDFLKKKVAFDIAVGRLATGQVVTEAAKRKANRTLKLGRGRLGKTSVFEDRGDWDERFNEPLLVLDFERLENEFRSREPALFGPRLRAENVRVLVVSGVVEMAYAPGTQSLHAVLLDGKGHGIQLRSEHRQGEPGALSVLSRQLQRKVRCVSGFVRLHRGRLELDPLSIVSNTVVPPALAEPTPIEATFHRATPAPQDPVGKAWGLCERASHQGFRFMTPVWREDCARTAAELKRAGFPILSDLLLKMAKNLNLESWHACALRASLLED